MRGFFNKLWYFVRVLARADRDYRELRLRVQQQKMMLKDLGFQVSRIQRDINTLTNRLVK